MMGRQIRRATPRPGSGLTADLFLLHARSVYDFRERDDMLFAYPSDSDNVASVYEMYPIGWFSIKQRLAACGFDAKIVNITSLMLIYPDLDVRRLRVSFEQFNLTSQDTLRKMGESTDSYIMLSLEPHDLKISAAAGRGTCTMAEMEDWIPRALDAGVKGIMVWFFIGMPYQDRQSVLDTVAYSERLIRKFGGWKALPLICPMVPFLDPGSRFFEEPAQHGYRIFHRTLEEHRQAMVEPLWHRRLNYETRWLDGRQLQDVSYEAIARLVEFNGERGVLPSAFCRAIRVTIDATVPRQMIEECLTSRPAR